MKKTIALTIVAIFLFSTFLPVFAAQNKKIGFMVIAEDRGFVGNNETVNLFNQFEREYLSSLVFVGRKYDGIKSEYSEYIQKGISELDNKGVSEIVILPLFLSESNHILKMLRKNIPSYHFKGDIRWNRAMSGSYLIAQILLDSVNKLSKNPTEENLLLIGRGAIDEKSEKLIKEELEQLVNYIKKRKTYKSVQVGVYYSYNADEKIRKTKDNEVDEMVIHAAAKTGRTLLVPFVIGPKYSHMMSFTHFVERRFEDIDLIYHSDEILLHPNVLIWMKKAANAHIPISNNNPIGVVIMPHGATKPYNDAIEKTIQPLKKKYQVEMAYGMGDSISLQNAVSNLEGKGIKRIVFVRMYPSSDQFKEKTDYILGLDSRVPEQWDGLIPSQVRTSAIINTYGGYEEDSLIAGIFLDRIKEVSKNPTEETIILLAHGGKNEQAEKLRNEKMDSHISWIQKQSNPPFKKIIGMTLREDWPDKRAKALKEIKKVVKEGNSSGKVIIISNRLYGSGPYNHFLKGLEFEMNSKGLAPHPNLTKWIEKGIEIAVNKETLIMESSKKATMGNSFLRLAQSEASESQDTVSARDMKAKRSTGVIILKDVPKGASLKNNTTKNIEDLREPNRK
jgi:sirohydrochlorin ferrochelatase